LNPLKPLREVFAPYEIAAGAVCVQCAFGLAGVALIFAGRTGAFPLLFLSVVAAVFPHVAVSCPRCGKSPMRYYMTPWGEQRGGMPMGKRWWPERRCSSCGTELDIL
jgi:hypothetical protein